MQATVAYYLPTALILAPTRILLSLARPSPANCCHGTDASEEEEEYRAHRAHGVRQGKAGDF
jgi:hypothetical protein